ncbi:MAG TPA: NUDIX domain-containing protein [Ktedonobacteraceae bacterium]|nr:NUDIX domain-containing protein [Ktedonobacteraceae bacterium]
MAQRTATSAGAIILREVEGEIKIALAQHPRTTKPWVLPKGHVEEGETIEQAALREIYEETGLVDVQLITHLGTIIRESQKSNGDVEQKTIHFYLAYAPDKSQPHIPSDARFVDPGWFSPAEALQLLPYEGEQAFLREHLSLLFEDQQNHA